MKNKPVAFKLFPMRCRQSGDGLKRHLKTSHSMARSIGHSSQKDFFLLGLVSLFICVLSEELHVLMDERYNKILYTWILC